MVYLLELITSKKYPNFVENYFNIPENIILNIPGNEIPLCKYIKKQISLDGVEEKYQKEKMENKEKENKQDEIIDQINELDKQKKTRYGVNARVLLPPPTLQLSV